MITKREILGLYQTLNKMGTLSGVKFAYAVSKNLSTLKPEIESLEKALEESPEFKKFDEKRIELAKSHAKKDDKGKPKVVGNAYDLEDEEAFEKELEALKAEFKDVIDARQKQVDEYNELLDTESTVVLHKVALSDVPNNITVNQMYGISPIVEEGIPSPFPIK